MERYAKKLKIPHFKGVLMRNELNNNNNKKKKKSSNRECAILNLQTNRESGSHWVAYKKRGDIVEYFDSFGNLPPPKELKNYFHDCKIYYNYNRFQDYNTYNCGHLCLKFLYESLDNAHAVKL